MAGEPRHRGRLLTLFDPLLGEYRFALNRSICKHKYVRNRQVVVGQLSYVRDHRTIASSGELAAAIDRLVHHATILEFTVPSYRTRKRRPSNAAHAGDTVDANAGRPDEGDECGAR